MTDWPDARETYDAVAVDYAAAFAEELVGKPFDRGVLDAFAATTTGSVLDIGCGPAGHVAGYLAARGVAVRGMDISPVAVAEARRRVPGVDFEVGDLLDLPVADGSLAGVVAFYSVVHLPRERLPRAFAEFARVLAPGGLLLLAAHGGEGVVGADDWFGHPVSIRTTLLGADELTGLAAGAGFTVRELREREPYPAEYPTARRYLLAEVDRQP